MDECGHNHYVPPTCTLSVTFALELLLFVSALLTSLTGALAGTRAAEARQVEASAFIQAAADTVVESEAAASDRPLPRKGTHFSEYSALARTELAEGITPDFERLLE